MNNTEFARDVARWQMKQVQWYRVSVVFVAVTIAEDFLYKGKALDSTCCQEFTF